MAVKAHLVALVQAPAPAVAEQVRRGALLEVRKNLAHEVTEMIRSHFVRSDVFVETVAATVNVVIDVLFKTVAAPIDAEMDGFRDYLGRLKEHLQEYIASEMRTEGEQIIVTILQRINEARVTSDL